MQMDSDNATPSPSMPSIPRQVGSFRICHQHILVVLNAIHRYKWTSECNETMRHCLHLRNPYCVRYAFCGIVTTIHDVELPLGTNEWRCTRRRCHHSAPSCAVRESRCMGFSGCYHHFLLTRNTIHRCKLTAMMRYRLQIRTQHPTGCGFIIPYLCHAELAFTGTDERQLAGQHTGPDQHTASHQ